MRWLVQFLVVAHSAGMTSVAVLRRVSLNMAYVAFHCVLAGAGRIVALELQGARVCVDVLVVLQLL